MTTKLPYEPPRFGAYPTAPPWAADPSPPGEPAAFTPAAYPEVATPATGAPAPTVAEPAAAQAVTRTSLAGAPSVLPVVLYTCLFSVLGAVSAVRRADAAARDGHPRGTYWVAFAMAMMVNILVLSTVALTVLLPAAVR
jgi:hypothetical protein